MPTHLPSCVALQAFECRRLELAEAKMIQALDTAVTEPAKQRLVGARPKGSARLLCLPVACTLRLGNNTLYGYCGAVGKRYCGVGGYWVPFVCVLDPREKAKVCCLTV